MSNILKDNAFKFAAKHIILLALDVDGVLTGGNVVYDSNAVEHKSFNILDGFGLKLLQRVNIQVAIITGRQSAMVNKRANELAITHVIQGRSDKLQALTELCESLNLSLDQVAYMGDDLPDYNAVNNSRLGFAPANAHSDIKAIADYVTQQHGGNGAVREVCDILLKARGEYEALTAKYTATHE